jgi:uncharacterized integral membrane protein
MADHDDIENASGAVHRRDLARIVQLAVVVALIIAFVVVALDNRDDVRVGYAIGDAHAPVWMVIALSALGGLVIGWILRMRSRHRHD